MREELISLLEEAFEAGIVTSTIQTQIDTLKQRMKLSDGEYLKIEDEIRIDAYLKKVSERESKGITFMGDLRKQYRITDDDRIVIQEKAAAVPKKQSVPKAPSAPPKKQEEMPKSGQSNVMDRSEKLKEHPSESEEETEKNSKPAEKKESPKKTIHTTVVGPVPAKPLIVVADDNETQLFLTRSVLEENGYSCATAETPEAAVKIIAEQKPILVICDVNFGIGRPTGMDVFTNIRSKGLRMPFIIVSAFIQKEFRDHAKRIGVTEYVTKPTDPAELIAVIKKYIA